MSLPACRIDYVECSQFPTTLTPRRAGRSESCCIRIDKGDCGRFLLLSHLAMQAGVSHAACRIDEGECRQVPATFTPSHEDNGWQMDYQCVTKVTHG